MQKRLKSFFLIILKTTLSLSIHAQTLSWKKEITPFTNIGTNTIQSFTGYNILLHTGGIVATYGIIKSGIDYNIHNYFSRNKDTYNSITIPAVYIGYTVPVGLGGILYVSGLMNNNPKTAAAGCAVLQLALLAWTETSILKTFTGRQNPDNYAYTKENDKSNSFRFGFMRNGIHYGWPSGHLAVTTAVVSSLTSFYFDNNYIKIASWTAWTYMLFGVTAHEGNTMHWFSDIATGSMMGYAIGSTVGTNFRNIYNNSINSQTTNFKLTPQINTNYAGLHLSFIF